MTIKLWKYSLYSQDDSKKINKKWFIYSIYSKKLHNKIIYF